MKPRYKHLAAESEVLTLSEQKSLKVVIAQTNARVGAVADNVERITAQIDQARLEDQANLMIFPELVISGYPPEDILLRDDFLALCDWGLKEVVAASKGVAVVVGVPARAANGELENQAVVIQDGVILARYAKQHLPNYGVFDEARYFTAGNQPLVVDIDGLKLGVLIREDAWHHQTLQATREAGADLICTLNASPYHCQKPQHRIDQMLRQAQDLDCAIVYVNLVGGQDELVFDGHSFIATPGGCVAHQPGFTQSLGWFECDLEGQILAHGERATWDDDLAQIYQAIVCGISDYVRKNGFSGVVLGLSGGIDSSLVLAMAADAVGPENVLAVRLPSRYTSPISLEDAELQCKALGVRCETISIEPLFDGFCHALSDTFAGLADDVTEENLQARARGVILMAISNKFGGLLLTTGNKSELAVGYATLYGDMAGGFAPIKDVPKTRVYELARYRNQLGKTAEPTLFAIPERVITREPSAELRADQRDADSLPPYEILDQIIHAFVEADQSIDEIIAQGLDEATVRRVVGMILTSEYKRRQAPPGVRISARAFGRDRRYPISSGFRPDRG